MRPAGGTDDLATGTGGKDELQRGAVGERIGEADLAAWPAGGALGIIPYENCSLNHWYCSPNKIWEYAAAGVPLLASPLFVLKDMIETHGIGFLLADPLSPENIASVVAGLSDAALAEASRHCLAFIRRDNWSVYEQRLLALYETLAASEDARRGP